MKINYSSHILQIYLLLTNNILFRIYFLLTNNLLFIVTKNFLFIIIMSIIWVNLILINSQLLYLITSFFELFTIFFLFLNHYVSGHQSDYNPLFLPISLHLLIVVVYFNNCAILANHHQHNLILSIDPFVSLYRVIDCIASILFKIFLIILLSLFIMSLTMMPSTIFIIILSIIILIIYLTSISNGCLSTRPPLLNPL